MFRAVASLVVATVRRMGGGGKFAILTHYHLIVRRNILITTIVQGRGNSM